MGSETKERGILFSGEMVRATLREIDPKTQTRRIVKPQREWGGEPMALWKGDADEWIWNAPDYPDGKDDHIRCPYGVAGDRLWVRETWCEGLKRDAVLYRATEPRQLQKWKPSIHMPRWASRITLEITKVRVERLQDISEADAQAEGIPQRLEGSYVKMFSFLWDSINGKGAWDKNPWVWVIEFRRLNQV